MAHSGRCRRGARAPHQRAERAPGIEGRFGRKHLDSRDLGISHIIAVGGPKPEDGDGVMGVAAWPDSRH